MIGCAPERAETSSVTGTVNYRGKPVAGAQVQFMPAKGRPAAGQTDASGHFKLLTWSPDDGAVVGEHVVCVTKSVPAPNSDPGTPYPTMVSQLPQQYATPTKSPLRANVTAAGPNDFQFDLKDSP